MSKTMYFRKAAVSRTRGFTLVEMLVVVCLVGLLIGLAMPVTHGMLQASQITTASQMVVDQISLARHTAIARNRVVEVRFYQCQRAGRLSETDEITALQTFQFDARNEVSSPLGEVQWLPDGVIVSGSATLSTLISASREKTAWTDGDPKLALPGLLEGDGKSYKAYSLYFRPDGSTDLAVANENAPWCLSIHGAHESAATPANIVSVQVNPFNGTLRFHRPG